MGKEIETTVWLKTRLRGPASVYPDTLGFGGNSQHWGEDVGGLGTVPPAGSRGRAPGQGVWGRSPPEAGSFLLHK